MAFPPPSEYWRGQRKALRQLLWGVSPEGSVGTALVQALRQPLSHHVQQYVVLLLSLGDSLGEVGGRVERRRAVAQGVRLTQAPWFEKDRAGLGGHGPVLGGSKGHSFALGCLRYLALPRWSRQGPCKQTRNHTRV